MNRNQITLSVIAISMIIPSIAIAENIDVRTENVQVTTQNDGSIYVDTGNTSVSVPARRRTWYPWHYWRTPWQSQSLCRQSSYQKTTQVSSSGDQLVRHSSTSSYCR